MPLLFNIGTKGDNMTNNIVENINIENGWFVPLRGQCFFPDTIVGFDVARDKSLKSVEYSMNSDKTLIVATQKDASVNEPLQDDCYDTGVILTLKQVVKRHDDYVRVLAETGKRINIVSITEKDGALCCDYVIKDDITLPMDDDLLIASLRVLKKTFFEYVELNNSGETAARTLISGIEDPLKITNVIAGEIDVDYDIKQEILEIDLITEKIEKLIDIITKENNILELTKKINNRTLQNMSRGQKEYFLREQLEVIKSELGEGDSDDEDIDKWEKKLDELKLPEKVDEKIRKEIKKFRKMNMMSPDANVSRTYIETILDLPWNTSSETSLDIDRAEEILNQDHYGLTKVKERILENLSVLKLTKMIKGPIVCLVGPPGVGKTSIARSIARATNREFVRMSLGGVRDEAEIRGHRRTYVGAIPGRVINNIIEAGTNNPLFLLDEVDKLGNDFRGDPASALLEVLDPEQNKTFTDHYLEIPFDLSKVMFITTANTTQTIPRPLLDRMEIIELSSYIEEEKVQIAKRFLIPKVMNELGVDEEKVRFSDHAIKDLINYYTRESGVRNLERQISSLLRKIARKIVTDDRKVYRINQSNLKTYLGKHIYKEDDINKGSAIGVTTGMAWTSVGGVTLSIETVKMPGTGKLILTGQMGDVMKESAGTALGYIRSVSDKYGIDDKVFKDYDIQIHIPEGATPKDGPSAGITMCTALMSTLSGNRANRNIAMTGEITLTGRILPVGGIKEKVLAAYRQGINTILLPKNNEADIDEIPASVRKKLKFHMLEYADDAFKLVLENIDGNNDENK